MGVKVRERDGLWWIFVTDRGRRKAKKVGQKRAANKLAKEYEAILQLDGWEGLMLHLGEGPSDTVESYGQTWLDSPFNDSWKPATRTSYKAAFNGHIVPVLGKKRLVEVSRADVISFIEVTVKADYTQGQVNTNLTVLNGIFIQAMDAELVAVNPCQNLNRYKRKGKKASEPNPLTEEEAVKTLENAKKDSNPISYSLILTSLTSGVRPGELTGLEWRHFNPEDMTLKVEQTWSGGKLGKPKSGKSRLVDIPSQTVAELKKWRLSSGAVPLANMPIFPSNRGHRLSHNTTIRIVRRCAPKNVRMHDLRHTYATLRLTAGDSIFEVAGQLGHSSCEITARVYAHWLPSKQKEQIESLGQRLVGEG